MMSELLCRCLLSDKDTILLITIVSLCKCIGLSVTMTSDLHCHCMSKVTCKELSIIMMFDLLSLHAIMQMYSLVLHYVV